MPVGRWLEGGASGNEDGLQHADLALLCQAAHRLVGREGAQRLVEREHDARFPARLGKLGGDAAVSGDRPVAQHLPAFGSRSQNVMLSTLPDGADIGKADAGIPERSPGV